MPSTLEVRFNVKSLIICGLSYKPYGLLLFHKYIWPPLACHVLVKTGVHQVLSQEGTTIILGTLVNLRSVVGV